MPKFKKDPNAIQMHSPYKMKGSPMKRNYGISPLKDTNRSFDANIDKNTIYKGGQAKGPKSAVVGDSRNFLEKLVGFKGGKIYSTMGKTNWETRNGQTVAVVDTHSRSTGEKIESKKPKGNRSNQG